jgi:hypothetical protein
LPQPFAGFARTSVSVPDIPHKSPRMPSRPSGARLGIVPGMFLDTGDNHGISF